jgi:hypothetical protein
MLTNVIDEGTLQAVNFLLGLPLLTLVSGHVFNSVPGIERLPQLPLKATCYITPTHAEAPVSS